MPSAVFHKTMSAVSLIGDIEESSHGWKFRKTFKLIVPARDKHGDEIGCLCLIGENHDQVLISVNATDIIISGDSEVAQSYARYLANEFAFSGITCVVK